MYNKFITVVKFGLKKCTYMSNNWLCHIRCTWNVKELTVGVGRPRICYIIHPRSKRKKQNRKTKNLNIAYIITFSFEIDLMEPSIYTCAYTRTSRTNLVKRVLDSCIVGKETACNNNNKIALRVMTTDTTGRAQTPRGRPCATARMANVAANIIKKRLLHNIIILITYSDSTGLPCPVTILFIYYMQ